MSDQLFHDWPEADLRRILARNAAGVYGFDLDALTPAAGRFGPRVDEVARPLEALPPEPNEALLRDAAA